MRGVGTVVGKLLHEASIAPAKPKNVPSLVKATPISRQRAPVPVAMAVLTLWSGAVPSWGYPPLLVALVLGERSTRNGCAYSERQNRKSVKGQSGGEAEKA